LSVGLEEELILVDAHSLLPVDAVESVLARVERGDRCFAADLRACQVELRTPARLTAADAGRELASARRRLFALLPDHLRLLAVGTHPLVAAPVAVADRDRYHGIAREGSWGVRRGQPSGLHVHIGASDPDEALAVYNAARSYLPELIALTANSPFFEGTDSGLASTRLKLTEELPRAGIPPAFASWQSLAEFVLWARTGNSATDLSYLWWDLRPRPEFGTLEFRVADTQLNPADSAAFAAVCQALVAAGRRATQQRPAPAGARHAPADRESLAGAPRRPGREPDRPRERHCGTNPGARRTPARGARTPRRRARLHTRARPWQNAPPGKRRPPGAGIASIDGIDGLLEWIAGETERSVGDEQDPRPGTPAPVATP
jgi:carboxylate-amine ligase